MNCEHCHQPIPDGEPVYRAHARHGSYGRDVSGSVCEACSQKQPRPRYDRMGVMVFDQVSGGLAYKSQHFVPRCYLKPFSVSDEGRASDLYNIDRRIGVPNSPIKSSHAQVKTCCADGCRSNGVVLFRPIFRATVVAKIPVFNPTGNTGPIA
jgi:hypothetical protein